MVNLQMRELKEKSIKYLILDTECRKKNNLEWSMVSISMRGLNVYFKNVFILDIFLSDSLQNSYFTDDIVKLNFSSKTNYIAQLYKTEWFVENIFNALKFGQDGNIEIVGHNVDFDINILKECFHRHGYPFYWNDVIENQAHELEGPFRHIGHDTLQIGQFLRAQLQSNHKNSKATLEDTAKAFGIPVHKEFLHVASYDCYLTERIFVKMQDMLSKYNYFSSEKLEASEEMEIEA